MFSEAPGLFLGRSPGALGSAALGLGAWGLGACSLGPWGLWGLGLGALGTSNRRSRQAIDTFDKLLKHYASRSLE